jgi:hypothetical protein
LQNESLVDLSQTKHRSRWSKEKLVDKIQARQTAFTILEVSVAATFRSIDAPVDAPVVFHPAANTRKPNLFEFPFRSPDALSRAPALIWNVEDQLGGSFHILVFQ